MDSFSEAKALSMLEEYHDKKIVLDESILQLSYKNFEYLKEFIDIHERK